MTLTRRAALVCGAAGLVSACVGGGSPGGGSGATTSWRAASNAGFDAWIAAYRERAVGRGLSPAVVDRALGTAGYLPAVIERDRNQTEFKRSLEDYLAIAVSDERLSLGRAKLRATAGSLAAIENRYGVEAHVIAAVWGLESFFGTRRGDAPVISALATLAYDGRRGDFFESQLTAALRILQNGDTTPERMTGSWAGAMGHTQFIPTSYLEFAVDFDGDGRRDIWGEDPTDALASTAAYLSRSGWRRGQPWGVEVRLPEGFAGPVGRGNGRAGSAWEAAGVRAADGGGLPDAGAGSIIAPAGRGGPAFLIFQNFNVILRYNNAESYAIGVGHLSDRLLGRPALAARFGPDATGLTIDDRKEIQRRLTAAGFDTEGSDGVIGDRTRAAIRAFEASRGLPVTGEPSLELLRRLR